MRFSILSSTSISSTKFAPAVACILLLLISNVTPVLGASIRKGINNYNSTNTFYLKSIGGSYAGRYLDVMTVSRGAQVLALAADTSKKSPVFLGQQLGTQHYGQLMAPLMASVNLTYAAAYYTGGENNVVYLGPDQVLPVGEPVSGFRLSPCNSTLMLRQAVGNLNGLLACGNTVSPQVQLFYAQAGVPFERSCEWVTLQVSP